MALKTPITYYGGKQTLATTILGMIPKHKIYVEPYLGGGAVFFAKGPSFLEVLNDKNEVLMKFYEVLQNKDDLKKLWKLVHGTLHSERSYKKAKKIYNNPKDYDDINIAWAFWMVTNMSYSASPGAGWKWDNGTSGTHSGTTLNNYRNQFTTKLFDRLRFVQISCRDALTVIRQRDSKETFFYLDPPYPNCDQKHYSGFTEDSLKELLDLLTTIKGKFILSNFSSQVLKKYIRQNDWNVEQIDLNMNVANFKDGPRRKKELLVYNYTIQQELQFKD